MSEPLTVETAESVVATVLRPMNEHGTMTVEVGARHSTRHVVEYETASVEQTLAAMPEGSRVRVAMTPLEGRANVWRVAAPTRRVDLREPPRRD